MAGNFENTAFTDPSHMQPCYSPHEDGFSPVSCSVIPVKSDMMSETESHFSFDVESMAANFSHITASAYRVPSPNHGSATAMNQYPFNNRALHQQHQVYDTTPSPTSVVTHSCIQAATGMIMQCIKPDKYGDYTDQASVVPYNEGFDNALISYNALPIMSSKPCYIVTSGLASPGQPSPISLDSAPDYSNYHSFDNIHTMISVPPPYSNNGDSHSRINSHSSISSLNRESNPIKLETFSLSRKNKENSGSSTTASKRQTRIKDSKKRCSNCCSTKSPSWRRSISPLTVGVLLCNACGLYEKTAKRKRMLVTQDDGIIKVVRKRDNRNYCCSTCGAKDVARWRVMMDSTVQCEKCSRTARHENHQRRR